MAGVMCASTLFAAPQRTAKQSNLETVTNITEFFSDAFGPNPNVKPETFLAPPTTGTGSQQINFGDRLASEFLLAEKIARAWWAEAITPASQNDALLSNGLAHYSAALWIEHAYGTEAYARTLGSFVVGSLMYGDTAIGQAGKLTLNSIEYRSIVQDKGAEVFHMLRVFLGEKTFQDVLREYYAAYRGKTARIADFKDVAASVLQKRSDAQKASQDLAVFFRQWIDSTGIPEPTIDYVVTRTPKGFRIVGKVKQGLETFRLPIELKIETEGNPEHKTIEAVGLESTFSVETFGRPKANGITLDPEHKLLISNRALRILSVVRRGELLSAEGKYYEATGEFKYALQLDDANALAHFRYGEAFFYMSQTQEAANQFRKAMNGDLKDCRWVEVWGHIYLGKIFDFLGQRERAVNEYDRAVHTNDNTAAAQEEAGRYLKKPFGTL